MNGQSQNGLAELLRCALTAHENVRDGSIHIAEQGSGQRGCTFEFELLNGYQGEAKVTGSIAVFTAQAPPDGPPAPQEFEVNRLDVISSHSTPEAAVRAAVGVIPNKDDQPPATAQELRGSDELEELLRAALTGNTSIVAATVALEKERPCHGAVSFSFEVNSVGPQHTRVAGHILGVPKGPGGRCAYQLKRLGVTSHHFTPDEAVRAAVGTVGE